MKLLLYLLGALPILTFGQQYVVNQDQFKYFVGKSEPDPNWAKVNFDDSNWESSKNEPDIISGSQSIGYGDGDDFIVIDTAPSVYIRIPFHANPDTLEDLQFQVDYDDGFVAYLNGKEIVRSNLGKYGETIPCNRLADRSHEATNYREDIFDNGLLDPSFIITADEVHSLMKKGENVLSIQVHNDSLNGSDLSFVCALQTHVRDPYNPYNSGYKQIDLDSSHLPIVKIEIDSELGIYEHKRYTNGKMKIIHREGAYNKPEDNANVYDGNISIATRGQSTLYWQKRCFKLETQDLNHNNRNVTILNLPEENDWILFGPLADRSLIRNKLMYDLGEAMGQYTPRSFFCELIYKGQYWGVYQFMEKIKRDRNRIAIRRLNSDENTGNDLTGGYIIKYDKTDSYTGDDKDVLNIVYPDKDDITEEQRTYILDFDQAFNESIKKENMYDPDYGYRNYLDTKSYIDFTILNEFAKNPDAYLYSTYFYKDRDDISKKYHFGPIWDFDLAFGNSIFQEGDEVEGWQFEVNYKLNQMKLFQDSTLFAEFSLRWQNLRKTTLCNDSVFNRIDNLVSYLGDAIDRNNYVWQHDSVDMAMYGSIFSFTKSYDEEIPMLKKWIKDRSDWIDNNIDDYNAPNGISEFNVFPTLCSNNIYCYIKESEFAYGMLTIYNVIGNIVVIREIEIIPGVSITPIKTNMLNSGIYLVIVEVEGRRIGFKKIIKE